MIKALAAKLYQNGSLEILKAGLQNEVYDAIAAEIYREEPHGIILVETNYMWQNNKAFDYIEELSKDSSKLHELVNSGNHTIQYRDGSQILIKNAKDINPERMDPTPIPLGAYCYTRRQPQEGEPATKPDGTPIYYITPCPYLTTKSFNGVEVPWCSFLNQGGTEGSLKIGQTPEQAEAEWKKLVEHFGSDDAVHNALPLGLLFDSVKECNLNLGREE